MGVFDTSVKTDATLPTWFTDAQKASATTGKTVYDSATPFSGTAGATMSKDLFGTPSQPNITGTTGNSGENGGASWSSSSLAGAGDMPAYASGNQMDPSMRGPHTEEDWNRLQSTAFFGPGADMDKIKADYLSGTMGAGGGSDTPNAGGLPSAPSTPSASNPFMTAMGTLQSVASGAANPWLENGDPNTKTALGGLFSAQNAKLNQILPEIAAQTGAGGIGGGNFGSLRGQTAVNTARAGALTTLAEQQNKAALDAQNYAIQAAKGVGDVGSQYSTSALNTSDAAMNSDINQWGKYSNIINAMGPNTDKSTTVTTKGSSYENLLKGLTAAGAAGVSIDKILAGNTGLGWLDNLMKTKGTTFVDADGNPVNDPTDYED